jgi:hypothetical protein
MGFSEIKESRTLKASPLIKLDTALVNLLLFKDELYVRTSKYDNIGQEKIESCKKELLK